MLEKLQLYFRACLISSDDYKNWASKNNRFNYINTAIVIIVRILEEKNVVWNMGVDISSLVDCILEELKENDIELDCALEAIRILEINYGQVNRINKLVQTLKIITKGGVIRSGTRRFRTVYKFLYNNRKIWNRLCR